MDTTAAYKAAALDVADIFTVEENGRAPKLRRKKMKKARMKVRCYCLAIIREKQPDVTDRHEGARYEVHRDQCWSASLIVSIARMSLQDA